MQANPLGDENATLASWNCAIDVLLEILVHVFGLKPLNNGLENPTEADVKWLNEAGATSRHMDNGCVGPSFQESSDIFGDLGFVYISSQELRLQKVWAKGTFPHVTTPVAPPPCGRMPWFLPDVFVDPCPEKSSRLTRGSPSVSQCL